MRFLPPWSYLRAASLFALALSVIALPSVAQESASYSNFSSTANLVCNGSAASSGSCITSETGNSTVLVLNPSTGGQAGSVWFSYPYTPDGRIPLANGFTSNFQFQFTNRESSPADGLAFVIQNVGTSALGAGGGGVGYQGFANLAIEFDTYQNSYDPRVPHVAIQSCGTSPNTADHSQVACDLGIASYFANPTFSGTNGSFDGVNTATLPGNTSYSSTLNGQEVFFFNNGANYLGQFYDLGAIAGGSSNSFQVSDPYSTPALSNDPYVVAPLLSTATPNFDDGNVHTITINYAIPAGCTSQCVGTLSVMVDTVNVLSTQVDLLDSLGLDSAGDAWVGFTAATGANFEEHDLVNWNFSSAAVLSTSLPPTSVTTNSPTVTANFNSMTGNLVQHTLNFSASDVTIPDGTALIPSNVAIAPASWLSYVAGTPFATTTCIPHTGEGGNCKLYIDLCTNSSSATPAGINCPQSNSRDITITDTFDASPKPATPAGTGFGLLMGGDNWSAQPSSCIFAGSEVNTPCPQNILTSFSGDPVSGGATKALNSSFVTISGVLMPVTAVSVPSLNSYGWTNTASPTVNFTSSPPGTAGGVTVPTNIPNTPNNNNNFVAAPIAGITYSVNAQPNPVTLPAAACPNSIVPGTTVATPFSASANLSGLIQGPNTISYSASDCGGTQELAFNFDSVNGNWSTAEKSTSIYVDTTLPVVSCPAADNSWHNGNVSISCSATDTGSGFNQSVSVVNGVSFGALNENIPLSTMVSGQVEVTNAETGSSTVSDLAGNGPVSVGPVGPFKIDTMSPVITAVLPAQGSIQNYLWNQTVKIAASYNCTDRGSGVAKCGTATYSTPVQGTTATISNNLNTTHLGQSQTFMVSATDAVGNSANATLFRYNVSYGFLGFLTLQPPPLTNPLKAGKATAILFDVFDGIAKPVNGLKLAPTGSVMVAAFSSLNCSGANPSPVAFNGKLTGLPLGVYSLTWTPASTLAGECVTLGVSLGDGTTHKVNLKF